MGYLSGSYFLDEDPRSGKFLTAGVNANGRFEAEFCSMRGSGLFVMSMPADIEVIDSPELIDYLKKQVRTALDKWGATDESDS